MSQLQRIIVRMGLERDVPALKDAELGWDLDTRTLRVGNESNVPYKIMSTGSTGTFDFSDVTVIFGSVQAPSLNGIDFGSLDADPGIMVSLGSGSFTSRSITSSDGSVSILHGNGVDGNIDLTVSTESISGALGSVNEALAELSLIVENLSTNVNTNDDEVAALIQLSGRPNKSTSLGTFPGNIIPDNVSIRTAFEALENAIDSATGTNASGLEPSITNREAATFNLTLSNTKFTVVPSATSELAGLLSADDKLKLNYLSLESPVDLNAVATGQEGIGAALQDLTNRVTELEVTPLSYYSLGELYWESTEEETTIDLVLNFPVVIVVDRIGSVTGSTLYEAVTLNSQAILDSEYTIHAYTKNITVFPNSSGSWFFLKEGLLCQKVGEVDNSDYVLLPLDASNNSVRVFRLESL